MAKILLVEHDALVGEMMCEALVEAGFTVDIATDFETGRAALLGGGHDLIVTEARVPNGSGEALAFLAQKLGKGAVITTGHPMVSQILTEEGTPHLQKPFLMRDLLRMVRLTLAAAAPLSTGAHPTAFARGRRGHLAPV